MRYFALVLLFIPAHAFAAAGFADAYHDRQQWIFPAYSYCLIFGLLLLFGMYAITLICKTKTRKFISSTSSYLIRHRIFAIIVTGVLWAIPLGIIGSVSWEIIWFLSILPCLALIIAFPICLVNRNFREKCLLSWFGIRWSAMISISAIFASLLFIILTNWNLLPGTDITYLARPDRWHPDLFFPIHPYDSLKEIWSTSFVFIAEIPIAIILYWLGLMNLCLCRKLSKIRHRKQEVFQDIYTED